MRTGFNAKLKEEELFCRNCSTVVLHLLCTKHGMGSTDSVSPREKILATCKNCEEMTLLFAADLRSLCEKKDEEFSCKILGKGRIVLGDWVYMPGHARPGKVKSRFSEQGKDCFTLVYDDGSERTIMQPKVNEAGKEAMITYRLLPFQLGHTRVGDHIYHVDRDQTGRAVGVLHGGDERMIVQLEDRSFLILHRGNMRSHTMDNIRLGEVVREAMQEVPAKRRGDLDVRIENGMVHLSGICSDLMERETVVRFLESLEGVLAVVSSVRIQPVVQAPDELLQTRIHHLIFNNVHGVLGVEVRVENAEVTLTGYVEHPGIEKELYSTLATVEGLREIHMKLKRRNSPSFADLEKTRLVVSALRNNGTLKTARIRVYTLNGAIYLEGSVQSNLQKSTAGLAAMWTGRNLNVVNQLRVDRRSSHSTESFIRIV